MSTASPVPLAASREAVRVSVVVKDARGFTHYYEEIETTPDAVRDAFDLMARRGSTGRGSTVR